MWEIAKMADRPLCVVVGIDAYKVIMDKIRGSGELYPKDEKLSNSTDVDDYQKSSEDR